ncbi:glutathione S-transferase [Mycena crocata]|nr:glutathione S-transferase [Mycena crocata]
MAILKLFGMRYSSCTWRVATVLSELKVPFELIEIDGKNGEHKTPAHLAKQPFGQIPYIDDDGFILYESRAICRYIAAKHPESGLIPADPKAHALFEQAASAELMNFEPSASKIVYELVMKPLFGVPNNPKQAEVPLAVLNHKLDAYDVILSKQRYIAGETLTLADLFHLPYAALLVKGGSDIMTRKPNVARWYNELVTRLCWLTYSDGVKTTTVY